MEQSWFQAVGWWSVGFLGLGIRYLYETMKVYGFKLEVLDDYWKDNALKVIFVALCYTGLCILWKSTDAIAFIPWGEQIGIEPHKINAYSIVVCFSADVLLFILLEKVMPKVREKFSPDA